MLTKIGVSMMIASALYSAFFFHEVLHGWFSLVFVIGVGLIGLDFYLTIRSALTTEPKLGFEDLNSQYREAMMKRDWRDLR